MGESEERPAIYASVALQLVASWRKRATGLREDDGDENFALAAGLDFAAGQLEGLAAVSAPVEPAGEVGTARHTIR